MKVAEIQSLIAKLSKDDRIEVLRKVSLEINVKNTKEAGRMFMSCIEHRSEIALRKNLLLPDQLTLHLTRQDLTGVFTGHDLEGIPNRGIPARISFPVCFHSVADGLGCTFLFSPETFDYRDVPSTFCQRDMRADQEIINFRNSILKIRRPASLSEVEKSLGIEALSDKYKDVTPHSIAHALGLPDNTSTCAAIRYHLRQFRSQGKIQSSEKGQNYRLTEQEWQRLLGYLRQQKRLMQKAIRRI